jgi:serine/threonine-protein kinase RsbW
VPTSDNEVVVRLTIPGKPEFVGVARLAILGVASRMRFNYDEVEDIRLAVGEACTTAIERAQGARAVDHELHVRCFIDLSRLVVEVSDSIPIPAVTELPKPESILDERCLGGVLIRILMDDVENIEDPDTGGRGVRMTKFVASPAR